MRESRNLCVHVGVEWSGAEKSVSERERAREREREREAGGRAGRQADADRKSVV